MSIHLMRARCCCSNPTCATTGCDRPGTNPHTSAVVTVIQTCADLTCTEDIAGAYVFQNKTIWGVFDNGAKCIITFRSPISSVWLSIYMEPGVIWAYLQHDSHIFAAPGDTGMARNVTDLVACDPITQRLVGEFDLYGSTCPTNPLTDCRGAVIRVTLS